MLKSATHRGRRARRRLALETIAGTLALLTIVLATAAGAGALPLRGSATVSGWSKQDPGTQKGLSDASFVDARHGWAVGIGGTVIATSDGGATWHAQDASTTYDLGGVDFVDLTHGWAVGLQTTENDEGTWDHDGMILATTDGGATWHKQFSRAEALVASVDFSDLSHGWAVGGKGTILATSDGGATWVTQDSSTKEALWDVVFPDSTHGWAVGDGPTILATSDGGATWTRQAMGAGAKFFTGVDFIDSSHGWAAGWSDTPRAGVIMATSDGGATWRQQTSGTTSGLGPVDFVDASHGWVAGAWGVILATSDGGATWREQRPGDRSDGVEGYVAVAFTDTTHGWAVGNDGALHGVILATTTGGQPPKPSGPPKIVKIKPPSAKRSASVTISGLNFGDAQGTSTVRFGSKKVTVVTSWSGTSITCQVPAGAKYGRVKVTVTTAAGKSNGKSFKVLR